MIDITANLEQSTYERSYSDKELIVRILECFRPHLGKVALIIICIFLQSMTVTGMIFFISDGISLLVKDLTMDKIIFIGAMIFLGGAGEWLFNFFWRSLNAKLVGDVLLQLRGDAFRETLEKDLSFFDRIPTGNLISRVGSDAGRFVSTIHLTLNLVSNALTVICILILLFWVQWELALWTLLITPLAFSSVLIFRTIARRTSQNERSHFSNINTALQETLSGISVSKNFRQEKAIYDEFVEVNQTLHASSLKQGIVLNSIFPLLFFLTGISTIALIYFGAIQVLEQTITIGEWYLFFRGLEMFWFPLVSIASFWSQFQLGLAASERIFALIDAESKIQQTDDKKVENLNGQIEFRDIDFQYDEQEVVLKNFQLKIQPGEKVALVGHTGAGKSSITKLIARFYEFQKGTLLIDDQDIRSFDLKHYRKHLGMLPQNPLLFSGTIADNIRYSSPDMSDSQIEQITHQICGGSWVQSLSHGIKTMVGKSGQNLSLGQRQLIAICRVLVSNPSILILDEATANIDPITESNIQRGLKTVLQNRTAIIIAHRLSTIQFVDRILVLQNGRIVEEGNHDELLLRGQYYADLYNTYFRHQAESYQPEETLLSKTNREVVVV